MDYKKIYNQLINRAQSENRQKGCGIYFERHHIIPKCIGGTNDPTNLVLLTGKEHFIAHKLLCEIYLDNNKLHYALWRMMNLQSKKHVRNYNISSREYERCKSVQSKLVQQLGNRNKHLVSEETRNKMRLAKLGTTISNETRKKISNTLSGHKQKPETIELRRSKLIGKPGYWLGKTRSIDHKQKIKNTLSNKPIITCPHCSKSSKANCFKFYHFENCKFKK